MTIIGTANVGIDQKGTVTVYVPPTVAVVEQGSAVTYGPPQEIVSGETLAAGTWEVQSGNLVADGAVTVVPVTIVAPGG